MNNNKQEKEDIFEKFTNLYALSKTLRFELKPTEKTQKMLEDAQVFSKDEIIRKKYEARSHILIGFIESL